MDTLNETTRTMRTIAVAVIGFTSLAVLGGCAVGGLAVAPSTATITPAVPATPVTPVAPVAPVAAPTFQSDLTGMALNTVTNRFYVANAAGDRETLDSGKVLVFDASTNQLLDTIFVGAFPTDIAVNSVTNTIYVTSINSQSLSVIDGTKDKVTATLTSVGTNPVAVAVNPVTNKIYVADGSAQYTSDGKSMLFPNLTVVSGATNTVVAQVAVLGGNPVGLAINSKTNTVYVATTIGLGVVNGANDTLTATLGSNMIGSAALDPTTHLPLYPEFYGSLDVAVDESTNTVYIANESTSKTLTAVDGETNSVIKSLPLFVLDALGAAVPSKARAVAVNPVSHMVYVTMETEDLTQNKYVFSVFNGATSTVLGTVGLDSRATNIAVSPATGLVYAVESQEVGVINITTGATSGLSVP